MSKGISKCNRFRPLAGINCNVATMVSAGIGLVLFPSPYGDKLQFLIDMLYDYDSVVSVPLRG